MCLCAYVVQILVSLLGLSIKVKVEPQETGWAINYHIADLCEQKTIAL